MHDILSCVQRNDPDRSGLRRNAVMWRRAVPQIRPPGLVADDCSRSILNGVLDAALLTRLVIVASAET